MNLENSDIMALLFGMGIMLFFLSIVFFHATYGYDPQTPDGIENLTHLIKNYYCVVYGQCS